MSNVCNRTDFQGRGEDEEVGGTGFERGIRNGESGKGGSCAKNDGGIGEVEGGGRPYVSGVARVCDCAKLDGGGVENNAYSYSE